MIAHPRRVSAWKSHTALTSASLAFLAMCPGALADITINTPTTTPVTITSGTLTITSTGSIAASTGNAVSASGTAGLITNAGSLSATGAGNAGLYNQSADPLMSTTLINSGTISGEAYAVRYEGWAWLVNSGTISSGNYALYVHSNPASNDGVTNSGTISGNVFTTNYLTITGGSGTAVGTWTGGTLRAKGGCFCGGNTVMNDAIDFGAFNADLMDGTVKLNAPMTAATYFQFSGTMDLGDTGSITTTSVVRLFGGTIVANPVTGNYVAGDRILLSAGSGFSGSAPTIAKTDITGLDYEINTVAAGSAKNIVATYHNDYVGGTLASIANSGTISGSPYGLYVAATGNLGTLNNSGTLGGTSYAIYNLGTMGPIANTGTISGNIASQTALTFTGGAASGTGILTGGTITAPGVTFASGHVALNDAVTAPTVANTGATLELSSAVAITGAYSQTGGALVSNVTSGSAYGALTVSGGASITNAVITITGTGYSGGQTLTLVDANAASTYSNITVNLVGASANRYRTKLATAGNDLQVMISNIVQFRDVGKTIGSGATAIGGILDGLAVGSHTVDTLAALAPADIAKGLKQLAPAEVGSTAALITRAQAIDTAVGDAIAARASAEPGTAVWGKALGAFAHRGANATAGGYDTSLWGLVMGADTKLGAQWRVGGAFSFSQGWNSGLNDLANSTNRADSYQLTGYAAWSKDAWHASGRIAAGLDEYKQSRGIDFAAVTAKADYSGHHYGIAVDGGYDIALDRLTITPTAAITWLRLGVDGYNETGAGDSALALRSQLDDQVTSTLGVKLSRAFDTSVGTLVPEMKVAWSHDFVNEKTWFAGSYAGEAFASTVGRIAGDGANVGAHVKLLKSGSVSFDAGYDGQFRSGYTAHVFALSAKIAL
jgi:outer membrane autotransporter protein